MIQCQGCTCAGWLWEGEGGLGDHQPGVYVPLKALFLVLAIFGRGPRAFLIGKCSDVNPEFGNFQNIHN